MWANGSHDSAKNYDIPSKQQKHNAINTLHHPLPRIVEGDDILLLRRDTSYQR